MKFNYHYLDDCERLEGVVIVIDVLRAFSNAAYAFGAGASEIRLVSTVEEALTLKRNHPGWLVMGEVGGLPPAGFDFGNSPTQMRKQSLSGISMVQRTGSGTQGVVLSRSASQLFAASFVVASATVRAVESLGVTEISFVISGGRGNEEDLACADYLRELFLGRRPDPSAFVQHVYHSFDALRHLDPALPDFPEEDLKYCTEIDAFDFSMRINREDNQLVMRSFR